MTKILIVEDEPAMVSGLRDNFEFEGYQVILRPMESRGWNARWPILRIW